RIAALALFQRAYGWVTPVDLDRVRQLGVAGYLARSARVPDAERWRPGLVLTAPDDVLRAEDSRAHRSAGRFALLGGAAVALLLGFAVIGAIGLRRDHGAVAVLLRRRVPARRSGRRRAGARPGRGDHRPDRRSAAAGAARPRRGVRRAGRQPAVAGTREPGRAAAAPALGRRPARPARGAASPVAAGGHGGVP